MGSNQIKMSNKKICEVWILSKWNLELKYVFMVSALFYKSYVNLLKEHKNTYWFVREWFGPNILSKTYKFDYDLYNYLKQVIPWKNSLTVYRVRKENTNKLSL